jgi:nicotinate-nucleotide adenylyltransferase
MPTGKSYLKDQSKILSAEARIELLKAATDGNDHFSVSDFETKKSGNTYTYETLKQLNAVDQNEVLYFIIGEDSIYYIETWREPQTIFDNCVLVVAPRDHEPDEKLISIRSHLEDKYGADIELLDAPDIDISSSMIRDRILRGASIKYYVPDKVADIIYSRGYYR